MQRARAIQRLVDEAASTGKTLASIADREGIKRPAMYAWSRKLRACATSAEKAFLSPVRVLPPSMPSAPLLIELRSGHKLHLPSDFDADALERAAKVLESC